MRPGALRQTPGETPAHAPTPADIAGKSYATHTNPEVLSNAQRRQLHRTGVVFTPCATRPGGRPNDRPRPHPEALDTADGNAERGDPDRRLHHESAVPTHRGTRSDDGRERPARPDLQRQRLHRVPRTRVADGQERRQLAALTPRSFQNGSRFEAFRRRLRASVDVDTLHLWRTGARCSARSTCSRRLCAGTAGYGRRARQRPPLVVITPADRERHATWRWSTDAAAKWRPGSAAKLRTPGDAIEETLTKWARTLPTINRLDLHVETGRHIHCRQRDTLSTEYATGAVRYYGVHHIENGRLRWPVDGMPNWYAPDPNRRPLQVSPQGRYVLTNRFAPSEQDPRAKACALTARDTENGFVASDRTNVVHARDGDHDEFDNDFADGLAGWISSAVANTLIASTLRIDPAQRVRSVSAPDAHERGPARNRARRAIEKAVATEFTNVLERTMTDETHRTAVLTERLRQVRRGLNGDPATPYDLREDTTALALMSIADNDDPAHRLDRLGREIVAIVQEAVPPEPRRRRRPPHRRGRAAVDAAEPDVRDEAETV